MIKKIGIPSALPLKQHPAPHSASAASSSLLDDPPAPAPLHTSTEPSSAAALALQHTNRDIRIYSQHFRKYELLVEYKNLRNPDHCPNGLYVIPDPENLYGKCRPRISRNASHTNTEWHGVLILHRGYYREGVFKFIMSIPEDYPNEAPTVRFLTDMFHPLVDRSGFFNIRQQFPIWRANTDYICHLLHYVKNSFKEAVLSNLEGCPCFSSIATNCKFFAGDRASLFESGGLQYVIFDAPRDVRVIHPFRFKNERHLFLRLASQCAQLSASDGVLYANNLEGSEDEDQSMIRFSPLDDETFEALQAEMLSSANVANVDRELEAKTKNSLQLHNNKALLSGIKNSNEHIARMLSN
ncbi:hypothetical protein HDU82_002564 [Entophlyctis luteolus]|nr:hypothetical protein HDU82_002564 [Entophlyctis luteolus]